MSEERLEVAAEMTTLSCLWDAVLVSVWPGSFDLIFKRDGTAKRLSRGPCCNTDDRSGLDVVLLTVPGNLQFFPERGPLRQNAK